MRSVPIHYCFVGVVASSLVGCLIGFRLNSVDDEFAAEFKVSSEANGPSAKSLASHRERGELQSRSQNRFNQSVSAVEEQMGAKAEDLDFVKELDGFLERPQGGDHFSHIADILNQWASQDSRGAFEWINENSDHLGTRLPDLYTLVMDHYIEQQPELSKAVLEDMNEGPLKKSLIGKLAHCLATKDPIRALDWGKTIQEPGARQGALDNAIHAYAAQDLEAAFQYASQLGNEGDRNHLLTQVGFVMAGTEPALLVSKLDEFPEDARAQLVPRAAWALSQNEPQRTAQWIETMPTGIVRDKAISEASSHLVAANPVQAFDLAISVTDPGNRYGLIREALMEWHKIDPEAAQTRLSSFPHFTDEQKSFLKDDLVKNAPVPDMVIPSF